MGQDISDDPNFYHGGARSPHDTAEAAMKEYRDQQPDSIHHVAEVDADAALKRFHQFQLDARELRKTLVEHRRAIADLMAKLDAAIEMVPDDTPRPEHWGR